MWQIQGNGNPLAFLAMIVENFYWNFNSGDRSGIDRMLAVQIK